MAVGDVVSDSFSIPATSSVYVQPAAGVEWLVTSIAYSVSAANNFYLSLRKGAVDSQLYYNTTAGGNAVDRPLNVKIWVTNTVYLNFYNASVGAQEGGYSGIQMK